MRWKEEQLRKVAYSGSHAIGQVVPVQGGPSDGQFMWQLDYEQGCCASITEAKEAVRRTWLIWLRQRDLAEVG